MSAQVAAALFAGAAGARPSPPFPPCDSGRLTRRHERRRWLVDKRIEACSARNTALGVGLEAHTQVEMFAGDLTTLTDATGELADKRQAVRLLASVTTRHGLAATGGRVGDSDG